MTAQNDAPSPSILRVLRRVNVGNRTEFFPVGGAVLGPRGQVITASHVVNAAIGVDLDSAGTPTDLLHLDFPFLGDTARVTGRVVRWAAPREGDIATIQIAAVPDAAVEAVFSLAKPDQGQSIRAFGFPEHAPEGVWATASVVGDLSAGTVQLDDDRVGGSAIAEGFSGTPVWARESEKPVVLGMITKADQGRRRSAAMVASVVLAAQFSVPEPQRGSSGWQMQTFRMSGLTALLNDLASYDASGMDEAPSGHTRQQIENMATSLSQISQAALWENEVSPLNRMRQIRNLYIRWADEPAGASGHAKRRQWRDQMTDERAELSALLRQARGPIELSEDFEQVALDLMDFLGNIADKFPKVFPHVRKAVAAYRRRNRQAK